MAAMAGDYPSAPDYVPALPSVLDLHHGMNLTPEETEARKQAVRETRALRFRQELADLPQPPAYLGVRRSSEPLRASAPAAASGVSKAGEAERYVVVFRDEAFPYAFPKDRMGPSERVHRSGRTFTALANELSEQSRFPILCAWERSGVGFAAELTPGQIAALAQREDIEAIVPDVPMILDTEQSGPEYNEIFDENWGLSRIDERNFHGETLFSYLAESGSSSIYRYRYDGTGVSIYVVDSGIRASHSDFTGRVETGHAVVFGETTADEVGHGTSVSSGAMGTTYGVAKDAHVIPVDATDANGALSLANIISGLDWIAGHHDDDPAVVNISSGSYLDPENSQQNSLIEAYEEAIDALLDEGVVVVVSAGNENHDLNSENSHLGVRGDRYPAEFPQVVTVAASDLDAYVDGQNQFIYSSATERVGSNWHSRYGDGTSPPSGTNYGSVIDLFAPGGWITVASNTGDSATTSSVGTSVAAPMVAGAVARLLERDPTASPVEIRDALVNRATVNALTAFSVPNVFAAGVGTPNRVLFTYNWWYPLHTDLEYANSGESLTTYWFDRSELGDADGNGDGYSWLWTNRSNHPWVWRDNGNGLVGTPGEGDWLYFNDTPHHWWFFNDTTQAWIAVWE